MILLRIVSRATLFSDLFLTMVKSSDLRGISGSSLSRLSHTHMSVSCTSSSARSTATNREA